MASSSPPGHVFAVAPLVSNVMRYVTVAQFTAYLYDWLLSISEEYKVISRAGFTWPIVIYILSRITTLGHLLLIVIFTYAPTGHCTPLTALHATFAAIRAISTSYLFLLRVRAVFLRSRSATALFGILWLVAAALNILNDGTIRPAPPPAIFCIAFQLKYSTYPSISSFVFDTFVFIAISYRLAVNAPTGKGWGACLQSVVTGKGLYKVSKVLMASGLLYYLAIILFFWLNLTLSLSPLVPFSAKYVLNTPYLAFTNIMACRVFRGVALGALDTTPTTASSTRIAIAFELGPVGTVPSPQCATSKV